MSNANDKTINPASLPEKDAFTQKEHFQHPQPADMGKPLEDADRDPTLTGKEDLRSSKEEGFNENKSKGNAGAFEGFEDQEKNAP